MTSFEDGDVSIRLRGEYVIVRRKGRVVLSYNPWEDGDLLYSDREHSEYGIDDGEEAETETEAAEPALSASEPFSVLLALVMTGGGALAVLMTLVALFLTGERRLLIELGWILAALGFATWTLFRDWRRGIQETRKARLGAPPSAEE